MRKRFLLCFLIIGILGTLLYVGCAYPVVSEPAPSATDWYTGNEAPCCPGDWDEAPIYSWAIAIPGHVTRTTAFVYDGTYSYEHFAQADIAQCWSFTMISCTVPVTHGRIEASIYISGNAEPFVYPGEVTEYQHNMIAAGEFGGYSLMPAGYPIWYDYLDIYFDYPEKRAYLECNVCNPAQRWPMGNVSADRWYQYRVEWNLSEGMVGTGWITATQDGTIWVAVNGLDTVSGGSYYDPTALGVGVKEWSHFLSDFHYIYLDDITIHGCDEPFPAPAPAPACKQYGHAAVVNVSPDCRGALRFRLPPDLPLDVDIHAALVDLYVVASETPTETLYVTTLVPLWGETTTDWCRRMVGDEWIEPGADNVPGDRLPDVLASVVITGTGYWATVLLDPAIVETWNETRAANPGLIIFNDNMNGKVSFASREWYATTHGEYEPRLRVWYTD